MEYDVVLSGRPTTARIERKWLEDSLALARLGGFTDLPPIEEIYTDRFSAVQRRLTRGPRWARLLQAI